MKWALPNENLRHKYLLQATRFCFPYASFYNASFTWQAQKVKKIPKKALGMSLDSIHIFAAKFSCRQGSPIAIIVQCSAMDSGQPQTHAEKRLIQDPNYILMYPTPATTRGKCIYFEFISVLFWIEAQPLLFHAFLCFLPFGHTFKTFGFIGAGCVWGWGGSIYASFLDENIS